ncbi:MAG: hypothetical protein PF487_04780 [Bacteroidales bacterium]|jgi:hypothetical protein|nr:hypothetical protein [Bacteroidales bacterium]
MKKLLIFTLISILSICQSFSQKIRNKQFALFSYHLDISDDFREEISSLSSYLNEIKTYKNPGNDQLKAVLIHNIYYSIEEALEEQLGIEILPVNSFQSKVDYNDYGYPETSIRRSLRKGYSKYYLKINVKIESLTEEKKEENPELFEEISGTVIIPQITINITVFNDEGIIPVDKWFGKAGAKTPLAINNYLLKGFDRSENSANKAENLASLRDKAIKQLIEKFLNN